MLEALLKGTADPAEIAAFAQSRAKKKIPQIMAALEENLMSDHHRTMVRFSIEHMRFLEEQIIALDEEIRRKIAAAGYVKQWELLRSLPAVKDSAATILALIQPSFPARKASAPGALCVQATTGVPDAAKPATPRKAIPGCGPRYAKAPGQFHE